MVRNIVKRDDHVSMDIDHLASSLRGKFKTLYPFSKDCCIYRVPPTIQMSNEGFFTPKIVSIGPYHHGKLKAMQEHKLRYLQDFLGRTKVTLEEFLLFIKENEVKLRNCYAETIELQSDEFVEMILLDAVFLIEVLLRNYAPEFCSVDRIFENPKMLMDITFDMLSLENQIPLFILTNLFSKANLEMPKSCEGTSLSRFTRVLFKQECKYLLINENFLETQFSKATHFVDLLRLCLQPPNQNDTKRRVDSEAAPSIIELHQAGIEFKVGSSSHLLDIRFHKGTLEIPMLTIGRVTMHLLRNLQVFERFHYRTNYINDYAMILNRLLNAPKDAELLIRNRVIENRILDSEGVSTFFQGLSADARIKYYDFYYSSLVKDLSSYCQSPYHKWKANLKQNYFNTPWASISVIAAGILLMLTFIQTVCSVIAL